VRLTTRLLLGVLGVVGVLVLFMVFVVDRQLSRRLREDMTDVLSRDARLIASTWEGGADAYELAHRAGSSLGRRVTLIGVDGVVVGDSDFDREGTARLENHASRPEVAAARSSGLGSSLRFSASRGDEELYVAVSTPKGTARVSVPTRSLDAVVANARRDITFAGGFALAIALVLAWLFARNISKPVIALRDVAATIAAGDLTPRPSLRAPGEIGELARALHQVAEQLSTRLQALQADESLLLQLTESLNEGVIAVDTARRVVRINEHARTMVGAAGPLPFPADQLPREMAFRAALDGALAGEPTEDVEIVISGRTVSVTALPLQGGGAVLALYDLTRLRRLEAVRRTFVANVSHELRTPLTVIGGFAETLVSDDLPLESRQLFSKKILANTRRMQRLVDDLLDLSRIELGGWVPSPVEADLESIATDALASARGLAREESLTMDTQIDDACATVWADPMALRQIIGNLVDNSVRHTATGTVTVFSRPREGGGVTVGVRDTGTGIPSEHLPRIFERFYRVDKGRARDEGGTGLGLAIVKHLVEAHGGKVRAESVVGEGTTILAHFPNRAI
jgi:two-component system phosphate regulon sensor histidine kinase PhoR